MTEVTLTEAKSHLRVSFSSDDDYVTDLLEAAEGFVSAIGVSLDTPVPAPVKHAVLLLVSHWYEHREAAGVSPPRSISFGVDALLQPYREQTL